MNIQQLFIDVNALGSFPQVSELQSVEVLDLLSSKNFYRNLLMQLKLNKSSMDYDHLFSQLNDAFFPNFFFKKHAKITNILANPVSVSGECLIVNKDIHQVFTEFKLDTFCVRPISVFDHELENCYNYFFYVFKYNRLSWIDLSNTKILKQTIQNNSIKLENLYFSSINETLDYKGLLYSLDIAFEHNASCDLFYIRTPTSNTYRYFLSNRLADKLMPYMDKSAVILPTENITINLYQEYMGLPFLF